MAAEIQAEQSRGAEVEDFLFTLSVCESKIKASLKGGFEHALGFSLFYGDKHGGNDEQEENGRGN
jgi:hypothetical protein